LTEKELEERIQALEKRMSWFNSELEQQTEILLELREAIKNTKTVTNVCQHCDKKFETSRKDTQYCSRRCKQAAYRMRKNLDDLSTNLN
jgi:hypothetical protein